MGRHMQHAALRRKHGRLTARYSFPPPADAAELVVANLTDAMANLTDAQALVQQAAGACLLPGASTFQNPCEWSAVKAH